MNQTTTTDIDVWQKTRSSRYAGPSEFATNVNMIQMPLPENLKVKGYALMPVIEDDSGAVAEIKTRALKPDDSLMNYDFSNCYIYDYFMNIYEGPQRNEDTTPNFVKPYVFNGGRMVRYAGEAVEK